MSVSHEAAVVRVWGASEKVVGAGFLVGPRQILTCAHVVNAALGRPRGAGERPELPVEVDWPVTAPGRQVLTRVAVWIPRGPMGEGDIAGLEFEGEPPEGSSVLQPLWPLESV